MTTNEFRNMTPADAQKACDAMNSTELLGLFNAMVDETEKGIGKVKKFSDRPTAVKRVMRLRKELGSVVADTVSNDLNEAELTEAGYDTLPGAAEDKRTSLASFKAEPTEEESDAEDAGAVAAGAVDETMEAAKDDAVMMASEENGDAPIKPVAEALLRTVAEYGISLGGQPGTRSDTMAKVMFVVNAVNAEPLKLTFYFPNHPNAVKFEQFAKQTDGVSGVVLEFTREPLRTPAAESPNPVVKTLAEVREETTPGNVAQTTEAKAAITRPRLGGKTIKVTDPDAAPPLWKGKRFQAFDLIQDGMTVAAWLEAVKAANLDKVGVDFLRFYEKEGLISLV